MRKNGVAYFDAYKTVPVIRVKFTATIEDARIILLII